MPIKWTLKQYLHSNHTEMTPTKLKKLIANKTGVSISLQNICNLVNKKPTMLRFKTIEIICTALECKLEDLCQITPNHKISKKERKLSYKNAPLSKRGVLDFPNPEDY